MSPAILLAKKRLEESKMNKILAFSFVLILAGGPWVGLGQAAAAEPEDVQPADVTPGDQAKHFAEFQRTLSGATLDGQYTMLRDDDTSQHPEKYTIQSVRKLPEGDFWLFQARIQYGGKDVTVPLPLEVKWAGDTPVITLSRLNIPGLGTFSSRVVIDGDKYAGTWSHDQVSGHLFGTIKRKELNDE